MALRSRRKTPFGPERQALLCLVPTCMREACKIAMFWVNQRTCSLLDTAQREEGQKRPQQDDVFYLEKGLVT